MKQNTIDLIIVGLLLLVAACVAYGAETNGKPPRTVTNASGDVFFDVPRNPFQGGLHSNEFRGLPPQLSERLPVWEIVFELRTNTIPLRHEWKLVGPTNELRVLETASMVYEMPVQIIHAWNARTTQWVTFRYDFESRATMVTNFMSTNVVTGVK